MADALAPTGEVVAALSLMGGWKPITAYSLRRHSGSGLSGKPPSEPFSFLKRATRFIISARVQVRIIFQASMGVIMNERHEAPPPAFPARRRRGRAGAGAGGGRRGAAGATRAPDDAELGDLRAFYEEAQRVARGQSDWLSVRLALATETQVFDTSVPFGKNVPPINDLTSFRLAVASRQPVVSDVESNGARPLVRIRIPVVLDSVVRYVVTVRIVPESFNDVLREQRLPDNWVIALVDRNRRFVARIPSMPPGRPVSETFRAAINRSPNGWFAG